MLRTNPLSISLSDILKPRSAFSTAFLYFFGISIVPPLSFSSPKLFFRNLTKSSSERFSSSSTTFSRTSSIILFFSDKILSLALSSSDDLLLLKMSSLSLSAILPILLARNSPSSFLFSIIVFSFSSASFIISFAFSSASLIILFKIF